MSHTSESVIKSHLLVFLETSDNLHSSQHDFRRNRREAALAVVTHFKSNHTNDCISAAIIQPDLSNGYPCRVWTGRLREFPCVPQCAQTPGQLEPLRGWTTRHGECPFPLAVRGSHVCLLTARSPLPTSKILRELSGLFYRQGASDTS